MAKSKRPKSAVKESQLPPGHGDDERKFRLRPSSPRNVSRGDIGWSIALKSVLHYARNSAKSWKAASGGSTSPRPRRAFSQRCAVRVTYSQNRTAGQWRAHGIYIARESAAGGRENAGFGDEEGGPEIASTLHQWQTSGDERIWKVILSPEFGERVDLERMTREVMRRSEKELGTSLEWVAVSHFNTKHPHVHLVIRGRRDDGIPLNLPREFVKQGLRSLAENVCTLQLGPRTELDAFAAAEREVNERRYTALDRALERRATPDGGDSKYCAVTVSPELHFRSSEAGMREQHLYARLIVLREMGLADRLNHQEWRVRSDFSSVLRAMQLATDRQRILASSGRVLSDERLRLNVLDFRKTREVQGRVLVHGEEEQGIGRGRHYLLLEGTDAQVHMIFYTPEMEDARSRGKLRANSFVRLQKRFVAGQPVVTVEDFGDANRLLTNKKLINVNAQRLIRKGVIPGEEGWGGWLGQYQAAVHRAASKMRIQSKSLSHGR